MLIRLILMAFCLYFLTDKANCQEQIKTKTKTELTQDGDTWTLKEITIQTSPTGTRTTIDVKPNLTKEQVKGMVEASEQRVQEAESQIDSAKVRAKAARRELNDLLDIINGAGKGGKANKDANAPTVEWYDYVIDLKVRFKDVPPPPDDDTEPAAVKYPVVYVYDADTYWVLFPDGVRRVRPVGFDSDEIKGKYMAEGQPYGDVVRDTIAKLLTGDSIELRIAGLDRYGRTLAQCYWRGQDLALLMLRNGWADYLTSSALGPNTRKAYQQERDAAKKAKRGRWAGKDVVTPRQWRKQYKVE